MTIQFEQEKTKKLVKKIQEGNQELFCELERLARPLMIHLSEYYASLHYKFEYDDFYSICMNALYEACIHYNPENPSFLSYAKSFMVNQCNKELEYWNVGKRNIFKKKEVLVGLEREIDTYEIRLLQLVTIEDKVMRKEVIDNVEKIINSIFDKDTAEILKMYLFNDMRPKDIADIKELKYGTAYSIIKRGKRRIAEEYEKRYTLDFIEGL